MLPAGSITLTTVLVSTYPIIFTPLEARGWTLGAVALLVDFCFFFYLSFRGTLESGLFGAAYPGVTPNKSKNLPAYVETSKLQTTQIRRNDTQSKLLLLCNP